MVRVREEAAGQMPEAPTYEGRQYVTGMVLVELVFPRGKKNSPKIIRIILYAPRKGSYFPVLG
jgi:hypothetical protein